MQVKNKKVLIVKIKAFRKDENYSLLIWKDTNEVTILKTFYDDSKQYVRQKGVCKYNKTIELTNIYIDLCFHQESPLNGGAKFAFCYWKQEQSPYLLLNADKPQQQKVRQRKVRK